MNTYILFDETGNIVEGLITTHLSAEEVQQIINKVKEEIDNYTTDDLAEALDGTIQWFSDYEMVYW